MPTYPTYPGPLPECPMPHPDWPGFLCDHCGAVVQAAPRPDFARRWKALAKDLRLRGGAQATYRNEALRLQAALAAACLERDEARDARDREHNHPRDHDYKAWGWQAVTSARAAGYGVALAELARLRSALAAAEGDRDALLSALRDIAAMAPKCDDCDALATHTHQWRGCQFYHCAEHAAGEVEAFRKAASKGCGKQPDVVPYVEPGGAIVIALQALADRLAATTADAGKP